MKRHHKKKKGRRNKGRNKFRRNDSAGSASLSASRRRPRFKAAPPDWRTLAAAVGGAVGSSVASGLLVNQKIAEPETTALLMVATGGLGAYLTGGNTRVAFTGVAAAGAGQYALAKLGKAALRKQAKEQDKKGSAAPQPPAPAQLAAAPASAAEPPRESAKGGMVVELFRDTAADLELLEEEDEANGVDDDEPIEIDLDEAA